MITYSEITNFYFSFKLKDSREYKKYVYHGVPYILVYTPYKDQSKRMHSCCKLILYSTYKFPTIRSAIEPDFATTSDTGKYQ